MRGERGGCAFGQLGETLAFCHAELESTPTVRSLQFGCGFLQACGKTGH